MKFVQTLFLFLSVFFSLNSKGQSNTQNLKCDNFRKGTFENYAGEHRVVITRHSKIQVEKSDFGKSKYKITWKSECEYDIKLIKTSISFSKKNIGKSYYVKIIEIKENEYTYECILEGTSQVDKGKMKKIK